MDRTCHPLDWYLHADWLWKVYTMQIFEVTGEEGKRGMRADRR